jgi:hypothetical protein
MSAPAIPVPAPSAPAATPSVSGVAPAASPAPSALPSVQRLEVAPRVANPSPQPRPSPDAAFRAAFAKFRATLSCAYFSALTQSAAKNAGYTAFVGRNGLGYAPHVGLFAVRAPELGTGGGSLKH